MAAFEEAKRRHGLDNAPHGEDDDEYEGLLVNEAEIEAMAARKDALFKILKVSHSNGRISGGTNRVLSNFHTLVGTGYVGQALARICLAFSVLRNAEKRRIYVEHGLAALKQSEAYHEYSVFDQDAYYVREHFYSGDDAEAREFLMMNGTSHSADELSSDANDSDSGEEMDGVEAGPGHGAPRPAVMERSPTPPPFPPMRGNKLHKRTAYLWATHKGWYVEKPKR